MSQFRLSRYGATCASKNTSDAEWMSQRRESKDEATLSSKKAAHYSQERARRQNFESREKLGIRAYQT